MRILVILFISILFFACAKEEMVTDTEPILKVPPGFPDPDFPEDNQLTMARWALGKKLFFDPELSVNKQLSCASCHLPELAFSDNLPFSMGVEGRIGTRNAPTLANVAYHPYFTREGGVPTLEMQILVPIQEHNEFDFNILLIADRLNKDSTYVSESYAAYDRAPDAFVITRALSTFERTMLSGGSRYDQFIHGNSSALSAAERRGKNLFFSDRLNCSKCHSDFNFTNYAFENNGLYETYPDDGRFRFSGDSNDIALFKVPTLRNVSITGPYMHDGSIGTLEEVVEHYNSGGKNHPHRSNLIQPLNLTEGEKADVVAFLNSLTDTDFITNPKFQQ